jgi:hypothetical protein
MLAVNSQIDEELFYFFLSVGFFFAVDPCFFVLTIFFLGGV